MQRQRRSTRRVRSSRRSVHASSLELEIAFAAGETIHSENSQKYRLEDIPKLLAEAGFELERQFFDRQRRFSLNLARPRR